MAMTSSQIEEIFKVIGKLIYLSELASPQIAAYKKTAMATIDQAIDGDADEFDLQGDVLQPMHSNVKNVTNAIALIPSQALASVQQYLSRIVAPMAGLSLGTAAATVWDTIIDEMETLSDTVKADGKFYTYVNTNFGKGLPTDAEGGETISDDWVTNEVV